MSDYVNILQTTATGFTPYFTSGYVFSTGAIANGGAWYDAYNASGLHSSGGFLVGISQDSSKLKSFLETSDLGSITFSDLDYADTGNYIISASDLRGTGIHYSGFGAAAGSAPLTASTDYHFAAYQEITGAAGLSTVVTGKIGIGNDFAGGFYEGTVTTNDSKVDFVTTFDTGSQSGSGIRLGKDLSLSMSFLDRAGDSVTSPSEFANNPYFSNLDIDIGTAPSSPVTIVRSGFKTNFQDPIFRFTEVDNINVFDTFTNNYTVRTRLTDEDGNISTGDFVVYGSPAPKIDSTLVQDAEGTFRNYNFSNFVSPHPTNPKAQALTNRSQVNTSAISGGIYIELDFPYGERVAYDRIDVYGASGQGNSFPLKPANFLTSHDISDGVNSLTLSRNFGITSDTPYYFALVPYSKGGVSGEAQSIGPFMIGEVALGLDPILYKNVANQKMKGCLDIQGCGLNIVGDGTAGATPPKLYVSGDSSGTGEGSRLTLNHVPYLLSGDAASSVTLQDVTDNGNTTTRDVSIGMSTAPSHTLEVSGSLAVIEGTRKPFTSEGTKVTIGSGTVGTAITADSTYGTVAIGSTAVTAANTLSVVGIGTTVPSLVVGTGSGTAGVSIGTGTAPVNSTFQVVGIGTTTPSIIVGTATGTSTAGVGIGTTEAPTSDTFSVVGIGSTTPTFVVKGGVGTQAGFVGIGSSNPQHGFDASTVKSANVGAANSSINSTGSAILGGATHQISGDFDVIVGGILGNISGGNFNFIGGGSGIDITGCEYSTSVGGYNNDIIQSHQSVIGGGRDNLIKFLNGNTIGGGHNNEIFSGQQTFVGGGYQNMITGNVNSSAIVGGTDNEIHDTYAFIGAGATNIIYDGGQGSVIAGGAGNEISGTASTVAGGLNNKLSGNYCFGMGYNAQVPDGIDGATVLADGQSRNHISSGSHTATLDFASGVYVPTTGFFNGLHVSGVPVLTGENNPAEADTLQTVTARGATTNQAISITNASTSALAVSTDALVVDGSNDRVGIGTATSMQSKLDVYGNVCVGAGGYYAGSIAAPTNGLLVEGNVGIGSTNPYNNTELNVYGSGTFGKSFFTVSAPVNGLAVEGAVGIGTNITPSLLGVYGNAAIGAGYASSSAAPTNGLAVEGNLGVGTYSPNTALDVRGTISGYTGLFNYKVGIGTDAPTEMLGIAPNTDVSAEIGRAHVGSVGHTDYAGFSHIDRNSTTEYALLQQSNGATYLNAANATNIYFKMNNSTLGGFNSSTDFYVDTDTLYVDASEDRVGINESSPSYTLDVTASDASSLLSRFYNSSSTNGQGLLLRAGETSNYNRILQCASRTDSKVMTVNSNGRVGIGTTEPTTTLEVIGDTNVDGHFAATSKSFLIDHPTKENKKLQYASLEGPEHGVFVRGTTNKNVIKLPDYWKDLVHEDSITVTLTPLHTFQSLYVKSKTPEQIVIGGVKKSYDYVVYAERKDIDKLEVEI